MTVLRLMLLFSTLLNVAWTLEALVREPVDDASTFSRSSSSCVLRRPLRSMMSAMYVSSKRFLR